MLTTECFSLKTGQINGEICEQEALQLVIGGLVFNFEQYAALITTCKA